MNAHSPSATLLDGAGAFLTVRASGLVFALPIARVRAIQRVSALTRVPHGPPHLLGLALLRGEIAPVVSLEHRLDSAAPLLETAPLAATCEIDGALAALAVPDIGEAIAARPQDVIDRKSTRLNS